MEYVKPISTHKKFAKVFIFTKKYIFTNGIHKQMALKTNVYLQYHTFFLKLQPPHSASIKLFENV